MPRLLKWTAAAGLAAGLFLLAASDELAARPSPKEAQKYIDQLKTSKDPKARADALTELGKLGQIQKALVAAAVDDMFAALDDKNAGVRAAAAKAVGMVNPDADKTVPALVKLLKEDKEEPVRIAAAEGLAAMGTDAKGANEDLRKVVKDEDKKSRLGKAANNALKQINPKKK